MALVRGGELLEEVELHAPSGFAHVLYGELGGLLERNRVKLAEVACFAAAAGPGSFTGVRVGLAAVKGLAEATEHPAAAVSNLQAIATFGSAALRASLLDARRGEIYGAVYDCGGAVVSPEVVMKLDAWVRSLPAGAEIVSPDDLGIAATLAPRAIAAAIARIAGVRYERGETVDPAGLDANYVRRSDAELLWRG